MKTFKKAVILSSMLLCSCMLPIESNGFQNISVSAMDSSMLSGTVSSDFNWSYDKETKTLTLSGKGYITYKEDPEWIDFASEIKNVVISDGITAISETYLDEWTSLDTFSFGKDMVDLDVLQHVSCKSEFIVSSENRKFSVYDGMVYNKSQSTLIASPTGKTEFHFPSSLRIIGKLAFSDSEASSIILPEGVIKIEANAFLGYQNLVVIPNSCKIYEYYSNDEKNINGQNGYPFYLYSKTNTSIDLDFTTGKTDFNSIVKEWSKVGYKTPDEIYNGSTESVSYGWKEVSGWTFYLSKNGLQNKGWVYENGSLYYFNIYSDTKGKYTGVQTVDGETCIFDDNGRLASSPSKNSYSAISADTFETILVSKSDVTLSTNLNGILYENGKASYYKDGKKLTSQWVEADGNYYYLNDYGVSVVNCWRIKDGKYRYLGSDGKMETNNWIKDYNKWYYVKEDGTRYESCWVKICSYWYWFGGSGKMMSNGWLKMADGKWYYFYPSGAMADNCWIKSGSKWYYLNASGVMVTNRWIKSSGKWYYLGRNGAMLTNTKTPDGHRVDKNGVWVN